VVDGRPYVQQMDDETFERIPWEHLSGSGPKRPPMSARNVLYALAGALAVAGVTAALAGRSQPAPTTTTLAAVVTTTTAPVPTTVTTMLTEASLAAVPDAAAEAAAWAEWVMELYLSVDGSAQTELAALFPPGTALPVPATEQRVFVESVRTLSVTEAGADFRAVVVARLLGATGTDAYRRLPDRAMVWTLRWQPEGWVLVDLPESAPSPQILPGAGFALGDVPEPVFSAAAVHGTVVGGGQVGDLWRVVVGVADELGGTWPVVVWFAPDGSPAS